MFTWICPKCGTEVPPSYSECPKCSGAAGQQAKPAEPAAPQPPAETPVFPAAAQPVAAVQAPAPASRPASGMHVPGWVLSILFGVLFVVVLGGVFLLYQSRHNPDNGAANATPGATLETPQQAAAAAQPDPLLSQLEITGLRLTEDAKQKPFVEFVVVNHSAADLGELAATVQLKASTGPHAQEPVGTFAFKTKLGPYESRDIKAPLKTKLRVYELPDWQFLRPELTK
jgi:ribosomal protein L40E